MKITGYWWYQAALDNHFGFHLFIRLFYFIHLSSLSSNFYIIFIFFSIFSWAHVVSIESLVLKPNKTVQATTRQKKKKESIQILPDKNTKATTTTLKRNRTQKKCTVSTNIAMLPVNINVSCKCKQSHIYLYIIYWIAISKSARNA